MGKTTVTVAIPVYNHASVVGRAIESVLAQRVQPTELLVIDDGSTDNLCEVVGGYHSSLIRYERRDHGGLVRSRNHAIRNAAGEYLAFLDADDALSPEYLAEVLATIAQGKPDMIYTGFSLSDDKGQVLRRSRQGISDAGKAFDLLLTYGNFISVSTVTVLRHAVQKLGGFYEGLLVNCGCEDWEMWTRLTSAGSISFIPKILVDKRYNPRGPYKRESENYRKDMKEVVDRALALRKDRTPHIRARAHANLYYLWARVETEDRHYLKAGRFLLQGTIRHPQLPLWLISRPRMRKSLTARGNKSDGRPTIAILQQVLPTYRMPLFQYLSSFLPYTFELYCGVPISGSGIRSSDPPANSVVHNVKNILLPWGWLFQRGVLRKGISSRYDIVIAEFSAGILSNPLVQIFRTLRGRKFIWWGSGYDPSAGRRDPIARMKRAAVGILARNADAIIAYSEHGREYYQRLGVSRERIFVALNSIDTKPLREERQRLLMNQDEVERLRNQLGFLTGPVVLFVGRLVKGKRVDVLLQSMQILKLGGTDAHLVIVGDGPEREALETLSSSLDTRATFVGGVYDKKQLARYFTLASLFVLPGLGGLALREALCFGLPIICAQADGTELELVENGVTGVLLSDPTPECLAAAMKEVLDDEKMRKQMGMESLRRDSEVGGIEEMAGAFAAAIEYAMGKG